ncbi:MAG TPA: ABC transporter ATP-binding protein [Candidatus Korarchaeota archaeon]|nr:ABC transporter ATP-binding protein [Candidatus Korarchaeota archaeon]
MGVLEVRNLTKMFGDLVAVDHVSFEVEGGEVFGFLGPNGAGKTTTLRMIYGVLQPTEGDVIVNGVSVREDPERVKKYLGIMPEDAGLYARLTAEENLLYFGKLRGMQETELRRVIPEILERLGLMEKRYVLADKLSKGMKRKLAFARAILHNPEILLLDEPTSGVDVVSAREIRTMISEYASEGGTVVLSTHNMWEVQQLCHRVGIINRGRLVYVGSVEELERLTGEKEFEEIFVRLIKGEVAE